MGLSFSINSPEVPKNKHIGRKVRNFERSENCESSRELCRDVWQHWPCWHAGHAGSCTKFALCEVRAMRYFATSELEKDTPLVFDRMPNRSGPNRIMENRRAEICVRRLFAIFKHFFDIFHDGMAASFGHFLGRQRHFIEPMIAPCYGAISYKLLFTQ